MNAIIIEAKHLERYKIEILFKDGHSSIVDFEPFLDSQIPQYLKAYKDLKLFVKFHIENGNIVWGEDWDLVFPRDQLYDGAVLPVIRQRIYS